ncbi:MAG TPA: hypothetical protein PKD83_02695 [Ignavibacteria bacterium]|nr:hypothetical protein [Ignavibacteria bacterium]
MDRKISDLSVIEFKNLIKEVIHEELENIETDEGLELREEVKDELREYIAEKKSGNVKVLDSDEVFKKLGV